MAEVRTAGVASPWPFVRALLRPMLLLELLLPIWIAAMLAAVLGGSGMEQLYDELFGEAPSAPPPDQLQQRLAGLVQLVSVCAVALSGYWYWHLARMLGGGGAWTLPQLVARLRGALMLGMFVAALLAAAGAWRLVTPREALALGALAAWWGAWPLLFLVFERRPLWWGALAVLGVCTLPHLAAREAPRMLAAAPLLVVAGAAMVRWAVTSDSVRAILQGLDNGRRTSGTWIESGPSREAAHGDRAVLRTADDWRLAIAAQMPRSAIGRRIPTALSRWFRVELALLCAVFYVAGFSPYLLLLYVGQAPPLFGGLWWPVGRQEQLQIARAIAYRDLIRDMVTIIASFACLLVARVPSFNFAVPAGDERYLMQIFGMLAVLPFVYEPRFPTAQQPSQGWRMMRTLGGMLVATTISIPFRELGMPFVALALAVLSFSLVGRAWRDRDTYLHRDLQLAARA
jgi:hypothetical protein